jgi:succinate dehydrogenase / fumarate reductase flavoprotein subunit
MGGLWVDYDLESTVPGLFVLGEANFSDHGANRLGASALMQGLADGYFVVPATIAGHLAGRRLPKVDREHPGFRDVERQVRAHVGRLLAAKGRRTADSFHRELGRLMWDHCGMSRNARGLAQARDRARELRERFWSEVCVPGDGRQFNAALEQAGRVADFLEFADLLLCDALHRNESCGGHFREEYQTPEGEALRDDRNFCYAAAWEHRGEGADAELYKEPLVFEHVPLTQRSYK